MRRRPNLVFMVADDLGFADADGLAWNATLPPIPDDASVNLGYRAVDMPQR